MTNAAKRILILTLSVGSGHVQASSVVRDAMADSAGPQEIRTLDAIALAESWFPWLYVQPYWWMLRYRRGCARVLREFKTFSPHLVIVTEIGAAEIAALGKREGWFSSPILAVLTDFQAEPPWVQPEIDFYCVATEQAKAQLIGWGISPHRILISGIPIDPVFSLPFSKAEMRSLLGLKARRHVVLLMAGGMGMAPLDQVATYLEQCGLQLQVLAVAGHDQALLGRLQRLRGKIALDLLPFGWTNRIPELMAASDLLITKPG